MARSIQVGLVQVNNSFSGQNYFPYSVGLLEAYARRHLRASADYAFGLPVYKRIPVAEAVAQLRGSDLVCFSAYVWNIRISLEIARRLKAEAPGTVIVFGGPQVPDRVEEFLRRNPFIDLACHGEGERVFTELLEAFPGRAWDGLQSVSFLRDGALVTKPRYPRIPDLADIPSPYLDGAFEPLIAAMPREHWIGMWETNRGCPFSCTFCDWGSATASKVTKFPLERLLAELEWFADRRIEFIFCADANFGMLPRDLELARAAAEVKRRKGYPHALSVQNTKNATERAYEVQKILSDAGMNKGVTISLQSMDAETLKAIKRDNISMETYQVLQRRFASEGIKTYSDIILGMPGETYGSLADGIGQVIDNGQHNRIQFNNLSILPNAEMGDPDYQRRYGMRLMESKVVNIHGSTDEEEEIHETQVLVVGTAATPEPDWVRARALCWWAALLHFDKLLQIPLILLRQEAGLPYPALFELFSDCGDAGLPVIAGLRRFFLEKARDIQLGGVEYCRGGPLGIWWPADELALIELSVSGRLDAFYAEAESLLAPRRGALPAAALEEALRLNRALLKQPFHSADLELPLRYDLPEYYRAALLTARAPLAQAPRRCQIDRTTQAWSSWEAWCREVVWWGNKQGAYLYGTTVSSTELAGHY